MEAISPDVQLPVESIWQPVDIGDDIISYNSWESKADGDAYESSGTFAEMLEKVKHTLAGQPMVKSYEVKK